MLAMAAECGTTDIVATPHCDLEYKFQPEVIRERMAELRAAIGDRLRLYEGCDFHLTYDNIQDALANPGKYTIDHKTYLLVEFSDLLIFNNSADIFANLMNSGILPVITHPERNRLLQQRLKKLQEWVEAGCYLQITASSILGRFGNTAREFCQQLIKENLVHFVASDAHDTKHRPTSSLKEAFEWVAQQYGESYATRLFVTNPKAALAGAPLEAMEAAPARARKWYQMWGRG